MDKTVLEIPPGVFRALHAHLLPDGADAERAAFVFASVEQASEALIFRYLEWLAVAPDATQVASAAYFELADETRAAVIKRAHDLGASLVEFHSHLGPWPAAFSLSDRAGFGEFVPHVWWRLKGRPYAAVVVAPTGFDALCWVTGPRTAQPLSYVQAGDIIHRPTGLTLPYWEKTDHD